MMRTFLALPLSENFSLDIRYALDQLKPQIPDVKWVDFMQVHLTLHFFGNVTAHEIQRIIEISRPVIAGFKAPAVCLKGAGCFPDERRPNVIWLGIGGENDRIAVLQSKLERQFQLAGFPTEDRTFVAHATVGRVRKDKRPQWTVPAALNNWQTEILPLSEVILYRSQLPPRGPYYESLEKFSFAV